MAYRITRKAEEDIDGLYRDGIATFGVDQAEAYFAGIEATFASLLNTRAPPANAARSTRPSACIPTNHM